MCALCLLGLTLRPATSEAATPAVFYPTADAHVRADVPDANYAKDTSLRVDGSPLSRAYIRFNVTSSAVTRATLKVYAQSSASTTGISAHSVTNNSWGENTINYLNAPPVGPLLAKTSSFSSGQWVSIDVTSAVAAGRVVSLALATTSTVARLLASRETTRKPRPVVQFDPFSYLKSLIEPVASATGHRYHVRDSAGKTMDTLKIIPDPAGGYLGVYHTRVGTEFTVKLATSADLLTWTWRADLEGRASQPTIARLSDGGFLVALEKHLGCTGTGAGDEDNCLKFLHYPNRGSLLAATADRALHVPRTLSNCAEGTPNIYSAALGPTIANSTIDVGFHYFRGCDVDRQARGTLTNFQSWSARVEPQLNAAFEAFEPGGNIGDRDNLAFEGQSFNIHEVQFRKGIFASWRAFLYDWATSRARRLDIQTHGGSTAFANPTLTSLTSPSGRPALVVTMFVPMGGAASGETGELVYYREL